MRIISQADNQSTHSAHYIQTCKYIYNVILLLIVKGMYCQKILILYYIYFKSFSLRLLLKYINMGGFHFTKSNIYTRYLDFCVLFTTLLLLTHQFV